MAKFVYIVPLTIFLTIFVIKQGNFPQETDLQSMDQSELSEMPTEVSNNSVHRDPPAISALSQSEKELKSTVDKLKPLMKIFQKMPIRSKRSVESQQNGTNADQVDKARGCGGGGCGGGGYGGYTSYCCEKDDIFPLLALLGLGLLFLYLVAVALTTTAAGGKRRRDINGGYTEQDIGKEKFTIIHILSLILCLIEEFLDGATWLSLVSELWDTHEAGDPFGCSRRLLCVMNHKARSSPISGWAASMSR